ncbi:MAG: glycoside hydrolase family 26 protein [Clostridia bacterium]|nr:glycoside hydrolase family 26 protein [Clostridia bacterium]
MKEAELSRIAALLGSKTPLGGVERALYFADGAYADEPKGKDVKLELYRKSSVTLADLPAGISYTLPVTQLAVDYSIAKYRTKITFKDCVLTVSAEAENPYPNLGFSDEKAWYIYCNEWLLRHVFNDSFLKNCGIARTYSPAHVFSEEEPYGDLNVKKGYDVYTYGLKIEGEGIEYPHYGLAVVRKTEDPVHFAFFVLKSKREERELLGEIVAGFSRFEPSGAAENYFDAGRPKANPRWSGETKAYFELLSASDRVHWGVFSYSMPGVENELCETDDNYRLHYGRSVRMQELIESAWGKPYDIYPTYTHIGKGTDAEHFTPHHFPLNMARKLAGGNGFNGKPVLQFTYQFTLNNNLVAEERTPMFDILRGKFDGHFRRLARDIKAYAKPVLFRLNNEMNTDWTSYCGMLTLCDPEIFNETWKRLYRIFEEEGADNCIWIWNPVAADVPYSSWGAHLSYFPGTDYVQLLGGTSYEMNNYEKEKAAESVVSFRSHYESLYRKNERAFRDWSMIVSEFACGSGGDYSGELGRNAAVQADWVRGMFRELNAAKKPDWVKQLKGAVWFNCNDLEDGKITNLLRFADPEGNRENDTLKAFREGFSNNNK